jgi:hypothetical protein
LKIEIIIFVGVVSILKINFNFYYIFLFSTTNKQTNKKKEEEINFFVAKEFLKKKSIC